jgi:predicted N-acetyltransferase YhbS
VDLVLRRATSDDLPAIALVDGRAFGMRYTDEELDDYRPLFVPEDYLLACDPANGQILGVTCHYPLAMTLPGGAILDVAGVSWVSVATTHRRQGVLRTMFTAQHRQFVADGLAMSILYASQAGIYGRFGYGPATISRNVEIDRRLVTFRADAPDPGGVRQVEADEARKHVTEVHQRWCAGTPGALGQSGPGGTTCSWIGRTAGVADRRCSTWCIRTASPHTGSTRRSGAAGWSNWWWRQLRRMSRCGACCSGWTWCTR